MEKIITIIPARWASSRFPDKPLAQIAGKPMIQWVYERASQATLVDNTIVATDDERIFQAVKNFGGNVEMTPGDLISGTDRVAFVAKDLDADIIINVQGDEPLIQPEAIDLVAETLQADDDAVMGTLARKITDAKELDNFNMARVVVNSDNHAMYFSRAVIPHARDIQDKKTWPDHFPYYAHIGIYSYHRDFLLRYENLPISVLEQAEKLEQLRALENGFIIKVGLCDFAPICVDIPEHIQAVEQRIKELQLHVD